MAPDDITPPSADDSESINHFPEIPLNDVGNLTAAPLNRFPDVNINDKGRKSINQPPLFEEFPEIDINDRGLDADPD